VAIKRDPPGEKNYLSFFSEILYDTPSREKTCRALCRYVRGFVAAFGAFGMKRIDNFFKLFPPLTQKRKFEWDDESMNGHTGGSPMRSFPLFASFRSIGVYPISSMMRTSGLHDPFFPERAGALIRLMVTLEQHFTREVIRFLKHTVSAFLNQKALQSQVALHADQVLQIWSFPDLHDGLFISDTQGFP
jgi:hypothetical protein